MASPFNRIPHAKTKSVSLKGIKLAQRQFWFDHSNNVKRLQEQGSEKI